MTDPDLLDASLIPQDATVYWFDGPGRYPAVYIEPAWPHTLTLLGGRICITGNTTAEWRNHPLAPATRRRKSRTHANILIIDYRDSSCGLAHTDHAAITTLHHDRTRTIPLPSFLAAYATGAPTPAASELARQVPALAAHLLAANGLPADDPQNQALEAEYMRIAEHLTATGRMPDTTLVPEWLRNGTSRHSAT